MSRAAARMPPGGIRRVSIAGHTVAVDDDKPTFWDRVERGTWEPGTLATLVPLLGPGVTFLDVDDTVRTVHGYAKQAAGFGYTRQRGLNIQLATISTPTSAPVVARARLRRGSCASATGVGRLLAQAHTTATAAGVTANSSAARVKFRCRAAASKVFSARVPGKFNAIASSNEI